MYVLIIVLYEQFSEGFRFLVLSFQPTHPPAPKSKFSLNTMVGHADADAMSIRNMSAWPTLLTWGVLEDQHNLVLVLEHILQVDDLVGI